MQTYIFEIRLTALSSIAHGGTKIGDTSLFRREKFVMADGRTIKEVTVISGNEMRGLMRDLAMLHALKSLGYDIVENGNGEASKPKIAGLSRAAHRFLFSGGALDSDGSSSYDIDKARRLRSIIPPASIFGSAVGNQTLEGKMKIGKVYPICRELSHILPERFYDGQGSFYEMLQEESYHRVDDLKNENLRYLVKPEELKLLDDKNKKNRDLAKKGEFVDTETGQHTQMRYHQETLCAGTQFYWEVILEDVTDIEYDAFMVCIGELIRLPYIGGLSGKGHGKIKLECDKWHVVAPELERVDTTLDVQIGKKYTAHLRDHGKEIRDELEKFS